MYKRITALIYYNFISVTNHITFINEIFINRDKRIVYYIYAYLVGNIQMAYILIKAHEHTLRGVEREKV